ncbi:MAG: RluA family pseudouridine synthase [Azospirillum sp.]|nr:RluA family pseudouridine synthase [Azospirillum sp.]
MAVNDQDQLPDDDDDFGEGSPEPGIVDAPRSETIHRCVVPVEASGRRLDRVLADAIPTLSRSRLQALLAEGCVDLSASKITDPAYRVKSGQTFAVIVPEASPSHLEAQDIPIDVVFEDEALLVVNKPAGLVVHPAPGNPDMTLVNALLAHCGNSLVGVGGERRPGIVHRLDKDTSGLLVVAKTGAAHVGLSSQFGDRTIRRTYVAVVWGVPSSATGEIVGNIGRSPRDRKKMAVVTRGGKYAQTRWRLLRRFGDVASLLECRLATGRTHQIRVHLASVGHPLVGDPLYGRARPKAGLRRLAEDDRRALAEFPRQALHAAEIAFLHPGREELLTFQTDLPQDIEGLISILERISTYPPGSG